MKGNLKLTLLLLLKGGALVTRELLDTLNYIGYHQSYRRLRGLPSKIPEHPILDLIIKRQLLGEYPSLEEAANKMLYKLKQEELVSRETPSSWKTTSKGKKFLDRLTKRFAPKPVYSSKPSSELKIVVFDIPESMRWKRQWLRTALAGLEFQMLQKSVWVGKNLLPEDFILDLEITNIHPYVHIFAVTRGGTLKQLS